MKTLTLTKTDLKALDTYFDEGPPLEGAIAMFWSKVERLQEPAPKGRNKVIMAFADLLDDDVEFMDFLVKRVQEGASLSSTLRVHVDMSTACE